MGSLFPSYHSFIREKNRQQVERDLLLNDNDDLPVGNPSPALRSLKEPAKKKKLEKFDLDVALKRLTSALGNSANDGTGGGENGNTFFLTELDDEIRRITSEEYLQSHRVDRGGLIKDELDLEHETYLDRISRMKTIWNKLLIIQREKERIITELENAIILRQESDTVLINEVQSGEALIKTLNERNVIMEKNLREALILEEGYKELIKCLKLNPPYLESHVQSLEVEVSLAEKQFNDLCVHRAKLYQESHKLEEVKKKALIERIQYFKTARQEIQVKKKSVAKELKHLKDTLGKSFGGAASAAAINLLTGNRDGSNTSRHHRKTHFSKHHHHRTKGTNNRGGRNSPNGSDNENDIIDSSDSDSSDSRSGGELQLTKPVRHFLNAIVRKVTYNEPIIKETDLTFQDVKKRAAIVINTNYEDKDDDDLEETDELGGNQPNDFIGSAPPSSSGKRRIGSRKASVQHFNSDGRFNASSNTISNNSNNNVGGYDSESVTSNTSITRFIGSNNGNTNVNNSGSKNLNNNPSITGAAQGNPNVVNNATRKRLTAEQVTKLRNVVKLLFAGNNNTGANGESVGPKENLRSQIQKAVHLLFQKTESNTYEEFIERYMQDQVLLESLKSQQVLVDSRLAQLRAEHAELYAVWSDISFLAEENNSTNISSIANNNTGATTPDNTDRYLDNQLFAKEVRMHHYQRLCENSIHTISEARTAVAHLMRVLVINSKLLSNLPRSNPPELNTDADMASCLSWCEDRVIALNEALTMDANRPAANAAEENKPIAQRQTELASLIYNMTADKRRARLNNSLKGQRKQQGAMSKGLINAIDNNAYISSPRGVMITPAGKIDKTYDSKVSKLISERDKHAEAVEGQNFFSRDVKASNEVQRFLNEGLDKVETKNMSRRAKQLVNKRSGRTASYGLVLEELLQSRGQTFEFPNNLTSQKPSPGKVAASKPAALVSTVASSPPTTANSPTKIPKAVAAVDGDGRRLSKNSKAHD